MHIEMESKEQLHITQSISQQLHRMLSARQQQGEIVGHNLEKGLGNEETLRQLLRSFLPQRFSVAKGKLINAAGHLSKHIDVIIYDALNCPTLFTDEHRNQILPIEGVYAVIEVKTTLTSTTMRDAFENLNSVYQLQARINCSTNPLVTHTPPCLKIFAFSDNRSLKTISAQFAALSKEYLVSESFSSYSKKSPGYAECTSDHFLVSSIDVLGKGNVRQMLNGTVDADPWGEYTLGMFLTSVLNAGRDVQLPEFTIENYLNWIMVADWQGRELEL